MSADASSSSSSSAATLDDGSQSGYAPHLHWCPHADTHVRPLDIGSDVMATLNPNSTTCSVCPNQRENWLCLHCHQLFCGRFAQAHMLAHREQSGHVLAAGLEDLSFWCYECENYLYHRTIPKLYAVYAVLHMLKFEEAPVDPPLPSAAPLRSSVAAAIQQEDPQARAEVQSRQVQGGQAATAAAAAAAASSASSATSAASSASSAPCPIEGLSAEELSHPTLQKILGVLYGNCLGDAFGLATEFLNKEQVHKLYGETYDPATGEGAIPFPHVQQTRHSARWEAGDWTDDSDQMILILETILETFSGRNKLCTTLTPSPQLFAKKLYKWVHEGFSELGDDGGQGLGRLTAQVVGHKAFRTDPHLAAEEVWVNGGKAAAANGGVMRTSITGVFDYEHLDRVIANTVAMCRVTHADPRCVASCVLVALLIARMLQGADTSSERRTETLLHECLARTLQEVPLGEHEEVFMQHFQPQPLADLRLDHATRIGYTLKCMASGLYGFRSKESFEVTLTRLAREGGDADTNGAVCGALLGGRLGYNGLPAAWLRALPHKRWLDAKIVSLLTLMKERHQHEERTGGQEVPASSNSTCTLM